MAILFAIAIMILIASFVFQPVAGPNAIIKTTHTNSGNSVINSTLPAINWSGTIDAKNKDVSNFRDGRFRVKTLQDSTWSFTLVHDKGDPPYLDAGPGLIDGQVITVYAFSSNSANTNAAYIVPCIVDTVGPKNDGVEGAVMYDVKASQHNGVVTYPAV